MFKYIYIYIYIYILPTVKKNLILFVDIVETVGIIGNIILSRLEVCYMYFIRFGWDRVRPMILLIHCSALTSAIIIMFVSGFYTYIGMWLYGSR